MVQLWLVPSMVQGTTTLWKGSLSLAMNCQYSTLSGFFHHFSQCSSYWAVMLMYPMGVTKQT